MITTPLISVILPVYNAEKYIFDAVQSILNQTYKNFELIIIDDGSTDDSINIISKFNDDRIHIYNNEKNLGLIATLNKGLKLCKGDFIARMDADDISFPTRFDEQIKYFKTHPEVDILGTNYEIFGDAHQISNLPNNLEQIKLELLFHNVICHPAVMMKRQSIKNMSYNSKYLHNEDWAFWLEGVKNGLTITNLNKVLLKYRQEGQNISLKHQQTDFKRTKLIYKDYLSNIIPTLTEQELNFHYYLSKKPINITQINLNDFKGYVNKLSQALIDNHFTPKVVNQFLNQKKLKLFYLLADSNKKLAIKYAFKFKLLNLKLLRYLL